MDEAKSVALEGTIQIVIQGLPAGVWPLDATGRTANGDPFVTVTNGTLAPGRSLRIPVGAFNRDPLAGPNHPTLDVFVDPLEPQLVKPLPARR